MKICTSIKTFYQFEKGSSFLMRKMTISSSYFFVRDDDFYEGTIVILKVKK